MVANLKIWTLHPYYSTLVFVMNKSSIYILENLWHRTQSTTMKKKKKVLLRTTRAPHLTPFPTTHFHSSYLFHRSSLLLTSLFFLFLLFHFHLALLFTPSSSPTVLTPNQHLHHHFSGKITGKFLWTHKHLHIFFEVKIYNLFLWVLYFCLWLFFSKI